MNLNNKLVLKNVMGFGKEFLKNSGIDSFLIDSQVLLMNATGFNKIQLFTHDDYVLSESEYSVYIDYIKRRALLEPVQYIIGKCEFMSLDFIVNNSTLIPRADTEILVEKAIELINANGYTEIIDIGTGSGAIAVSMAKYCRNTFVTAVDISKEAINTARKNAENNGVLERIKFVESNLFDSVELKKYDMILSNPPYIKTSEISTLMPQVKNYEPVSALDGGSDGLDFYFKIVSQCSDYLKNGGALIFEIGFEQGNDVKTILENNGFINTAVLKDLAGLDRVVLGIKNF